MGTVYLARLGGAGGFERLFAIKLMHEHLAQEPQFVAMLLDEARTAAHIHHPNAVGIIDARESPVGYYLVMNYVDGFSFSSILDHPRLDARTRMRLATRAIADAAHGLHAAHTAKSPKGERLAIVHRDVSPQNILVGVDGVGRIVDFGIALAASRIVSSRPGMLKGKPSYMAPEQARGELCDPRTDVFALGIVLWESLTSAPLFASEMDLATLVKVMECNVDPPTTHVPDLPEALTAVTMRALRKDPAERFATARELGVALERAAEAADLIADAHEVEAVLAELFAEEIALRQEAVTRRLSGSSGPERPLDRAGLATVPRLLPRKPGSSAEPDSEPSLPQAVGEHPSQSGVRESRSELVDPHAHTGLHESQPEVAAPPVGVVAAPERAVLAQPARRPRGVFVAAAITIAFAAIVATIAAALAAHDAPGVGPGANDAAPAPAVIVAPQPAQAPLRPATATPTSPVVAAPPEPVAAEPAVEPSADLPPQESGDFVPSPPPGAAHHGRRHAVTGTGSGSGTGATTSTPEVEVNPYLTH